MATKEKVLIIIDGNNFYFKIKTLGVKKHKSTEFDYRGFAKWLAQGRKIIGRNYYVGVVRAKPGDTKGQTMRKKQQQLFAHLTSKSQKYNVIRGYLMNSRGSYHEKGVDVRMAVDLIVGSYEDKFDNAILVSSDTDLIPALKHIRKQGKKVEYIGFSNKPSFALQKEADLSRLLIKTDIEQFIS